MSRLALLLACLCLLNGVCGCACCSCCPQTSGCCPLDGGYSVGADYPMDVGYDTGTSDCGCQGGDPNAAGYGYDSMQGDVGQGMPLAAQQYRSGSYVTNRPGVAMQPRYVNTNTSQKPIQQPQQRIRRVSQANPYGGNIQQASMSTWDTTPAAKPCNCGR